MVYGVITVRKINTCFTEFFRNVNACGIDGSFVKTKFIFPECFSNVYGCGNVTEAL